MSFWRRIFSIAGIGVGGLLSVVRPSLAGGTAQMPFPTGIPTAFVQESLNILGDGPIAVDGLYGPQTAGAVRRFQRQAGLAVDGIAGPDTDSALLSAIGSRYQLLMGSLGSNAPTLGAVGGAVIQLQLALKAAGFNPGPIDGFFLDQTGKALMAFQQKAGLPVTEIADAKTLSALASFVGRQLGSAAITRVPASASASQSSESPASTVKPSFSVLGFMTNWGPSDPSPQDAWNHISQINLLAPDFYRMNGAGQISGSGDAQLTSAYVARGKAVIPMVTNWGDGMLGSASVRQTAAENLLAVVEQNGYAGINIDFELLPSWDRDRFSAFVQTVSKLFHAHGLEVSVDVGPKITSDPSANPDASAYDYAALGAAADQVIIMTYDLHSDGSGPGPISTPAWDQKVLNYALSTMPASKVFLGIADYGYDWGGGNTTTVSDAQALALAAKYGATIQWSAQYDEPYFTYWQGSVEHQVWWDNSYALTYRLNVAHQAGVGGIAIWELGDEGNGFWQALG